MIKKDANQQSWIEKSNAIIKSIADEFDCVCYVDLSKSSEENDVEIFHASELLVARVPALRGECNLHKRLSLICNNFVCDDDHGFDIILDEYKKCSHYILEALDRIKNAYFN